jgi:hypothetical protein
MAASVRAELKYLNLNDIEIFTTQDGAANIIKTSTLSKSTKFQHRVAHGLYLLLTDGINKIQDLVDLLVHLKQAIQQLRAKVVTF